MDYLTFADLAQWYREQGFNLAEIITQEQIPEHVLHLFACDCAERMLLKKQKAGQKIDARLWKAIKAKRRWLQNELSNDELLNIRMETREIRNDTWVISWNALRNYGQDAAITVASIAIKDPEGRQQEIEWQRNRLMELFLINKYPSTMWQQEVEDMLFEDD